MSKGHMIKRSLAAATAIVAAGFPATAHAWSVQPNPNEQVAVAPSGAAANPVVRRTTASPVVQSNPDEQVAPRSTSVPSTIVRRRSPTGGFAWGAAAIGAGGAAVLLGAGLLGAGLTRRRTHRLAVS